MGNKISVGHMAAFMTIFIWGTTFISTKVLLQAFTPIEILFIRFAMGYVALWCVYPRRLVVTEKKQEGYFMAAGLLGITLYYLFENIALTYTLASNVGVIISVAPFFTVIFSCLLLKGGRPNGFFLLGFSLAMAGIFLICFGGSAALRINPLGDALALVAAAIWALYAMLTKKISDFGYNTIQATRRTFFYGLVFMAPALFFMDFNSDAQRLLSVKYLLNLLFLGLGASAMCFVTWNFAVKVLGSVKTSVYIYMVPVITAMTSAFVLGEPLTGKVICGIVLTLAGLFLSEWKREVKPGLEATCTEKAV